MDHLIHGCLLCYTTNLTEVYYAGVQVVFAGFW
jgi:hypothetical protein